VSTPSLEIRPQHVSGQHAGQGVPPFSGSGPAAGASPSKGSARRNTPSWSIRLLKRLLDSLGNPQVAIGLPNGTIIEPVDQRRVAGFVRFMDWRALWRILADPVFQFPELYAHGRIQVDGRLESTVAEVFAAMQRAGARKSLLARLTGQLHPPRGSSREAARDNIHHHYDLGNDFYALWLDSQMAYTCAYFQRPDQSLEEAQVAKFDHVCRKVGLAPGMQVIEAGCGWGGLALHMARQYGVTVRAFNISREQIQFARQWARDEGLDRQVEFIEDDWRSIRGSCDAFVSVGMLEHVGRRNYRLLGQVIDRCLASHGKGLIHTIGQNAPRPFNAWMERRIFPGAYPPALSELLEVFEPNGFSVLDVENLRLHYARTLQHWLDRFRAAETQVRGQFDDRFFRMWEFYLAGCLAAFATGGNQLFQVVFHREADNRIPLTREHLYRDSAKPGASPWTIWPPTPDGHGVV
jgi:cyclopropane-fatty-acyl-phospholipid synthase